MLKKVDLNNLNEVVDLAYQMNCDERTSCKAPFLKDRKTIEKRFIKTLEHPKEVIIAEYTDNELKGVFSYLVDQDSRYLECISGFFKDEKTLDHIINYMKNNYRGWHMDLVFPKENTMVLNYLKKINGNFDPVQLDMELEVGELKVQEIKSNLNIFEYDEKYYEEYHKIHTTNCYWIAEKIVKALDKFNIYLAVDNDEVVGYLDISKKNDIYDLFVKESLRGKGYGRALMQMGINQAIENEGKIILNVNEDNEIAYQLYKSLGFKEYGNSVTVGVEL
ncbi:GNAT family N-acetyltransferase [Dethiothermospora halolimnae]|uniref:GNAT family N-acetyltransferase n=1 Tax=Dethiothermospora halolimnae TaxID=3114390 RepID=UPI003CCC2F03